MKKKLALVVQRYGNDIVGGAEWLSKTTAENLHKKLGWDIHVFTTTAQDYVTWRGSYVEGEETIEGITVKRFRPFWFRSQLIFNGLSKIILPALRVLNKTWILRKLSWPLERLWLWAQGPYCPNLINELIAKEKEYDSILFMTYLYYPTIIGLPKIQKKTILIPTAHHEAPFYFHHSRRLLNSADLVLANTQKEKELICSTFPTIEPKCKVAGIGLDLPEIIKSQHNEKYILYLGRISEGKGVHQLIKWFNEYKETTHTSLKLVLAGKHDGSVKIPSTPYISYKGQVSEEEKYKLMANAKGLVNPSAMESLSIIVIEAMYLEIPVLVNGESPVLEEYASLNPSVFSYFNSNQFKSHLKAIDSSKWSESTTKDLLESKLWAKEHFSWDKILPIYQKEVSPNGERSLISS